MADSTLGDMQLLRSRSEGGMPRGNLKARKVAVGGKSLIGCKPVAMKEGSW